MPRRRWRAVGLGRASVLISSSVSVLEVQSLEPERRGREHREKNVSAKQPAASATPWFPRSHGDSGRAPGTQEPESQGAEATCGHNAAQAGSKIEGEAAIRDAYGSASERISSDCSAATEVKELRTSS